MTPRPCFIGDGRLFRQITASIYLNPLGDKPLSPTITLPYCKKDLEYANHMQRNTRSNVQSYAVANQSIHLLGDGLDSGIR